MCRLTAIKSIERTVWNVVCFITKVCVAAAMLPVATICLATLLINWTVCTHLKLLKTADLPSNTPVAQSLGPTRRNLSSLDCRSQFFRSRLNSIINLLCITSLLNWTVCVYIHLKLLNRQTYPGRHGWRCWVRWTVMNVHNSNRRSQYNTAQKHHEDKIQCWTPVTQIVHQITLH